MRNFNSVLTGKRLYLLLSAVLLTFISADSVSAQTVEAWREKKIAEIRAEVAAINRDAVKYTQTTKLIEDISLEGAEATYYRSARNLKKISAKMYGETYRATGEFYYAGGELIFAFLKRYQYDTQIGLDTPAKVIGSEEQRFYFSNGNLIRLLVGTTELKLGNEKYKQLKAGVISISGKLQGSYKIAGFGLVPKFVPQLIKEER